MSGFFQYLEWFWHLFYFSPMINFRFRFISAHFILILDYTVDKKFKFWRTKMQRYMCKGKIHRATVTEAILNYPGSITIDKELMKAVNLFPMKWFKLPTFERSTLENLCHSWGSTLGCYLFKRPTCAPFYEG